jgi:hypothetical protein
MAEKVRFTPDEIASRWNATLKASTDKIRQGVAKVDAAPSAKAIANKDVLKARLLEAIEKGRWERQLGKVTLDDYKRLMTDVGIPRIASGADANVGKVQDFAGKLIPAVNSALSKVAPIKPVTLEDSVNRMTTFVREMAKFKYK